MASPADIPVLVQRLRSSSRVAQLQAVKQLGELASGTDSCQAVVAAGGVPPLVGLLSASSTAVCKGAVGLLLGLMDQDPHAWEAAAAAEAMSALVATLQCGSSISQAAAAMVLSMMARQHSDSKAAIAAAGAIGPLVQLLHSGQGLAQRAVTDTLFWLANRRQPCSAAIAAAGAIPTLVQLIPVLHEHATLVLERLAWESEQRQEAIAGSCCGRCGLVVLHSRQSGIQGGGCSSQHTGKVPCFEQRGHRTDGARCAGQLGLWRPRGWESPVVRRPPAICAMLLEQQHPCSC